MPAKNKVNYRAAAHSDELSALSASVHRQVLKGYYVSLVSLDTLIRLATDLSRELRGTSGSQVPAADTTDPFLTEGPKVDVARLPTVQVPVPQTEKPKEEVKKSGFLGRN